ncbi:hypothetical protein ACHAWF_004170 [Thalassiosira exigua]
MNSSKLSLMRHAYALAVGTVAGVTSGLVGWGGAQIVIPSMSYPGPLASYSQLSATGIALSSLSLSSLSSGYRFWTDDQVNVPVAVMIGLPAVFSARVGTRLAKRLSGDALQLFFNGFSLLLIPTHFWIQRRRQALSASACSEVDTCSSSDDFRFEQKKGRNPYIVGDVEFYVQSDEKSSRNSTALGSMNDRFWETGLNNPILMQHVSFGLFSGMLSSLMGVGGLPLTISYLTVNTDLHHHEIQGTAVVALVPAILMSAASRISAIPPAAAACVAAGAFGGGLGGAKLALGISEDNLRHLFMGSLCFFGGINMMGAARNIQRIWTKP